MIHYEIVHYKPKDWFVYDFFKPMIIYLFGVTTSIIAIIKSIVNYKKTKKKIKLIPLIIVFSGIIIIAGIQASKKFLRNETILFANYDGGTNGLSLKLLENGSYVIHDYSYLGGNYHYGLFKIENDIIILDHVFQFRPEGKFIEDSLVVTNGRTLFHKDSNGKYDTTVYYMVINEEQR